MTKLNSIRQCRAAAGQSGVTLIELMVGMVIGLLAILVISQVMLVSEGQKRTTTGGADAQVNGALSMYAIQREIQVAGYGFASSPAIIGCPINVKFNSTALPASADFPATLAPVVITPNAARPVGSVGDSIRILASSKTSFSVPTRVIPPGVAAGGTTIPVSATIGFAPGDLALMAIDDVQPCWVFQVTGAPAAMSLPRADNGATWNQSGTPTQAYGDGNVLVNLGTVVDNRYEINVVNNVRVLQISSFDASNPGTRITRDVQSDIVDLRAYYGRDTSVPADGVVDVYDTTTPTTNADWLRVLSVRLIVVSRSGQYEKSVVPGEYVTSANPTLDVGLTPATTGATTCGASKCVTIDVGAGTAGDVEAKHYRYKTFETIIPLRNMLWRS